MHQAPFQSPPKIAKECSLHLNTCCSQDNARASRNKHNSLIKPLVLQTSIARPLRVKGWARQWAPSHTQNMVKACRASASDMKTVYRMKATERAQLTLPQRTHRLGTPERGSVCHQPPTAASLNSAPPQSSASLSLQPPQSLFPPSCKLWMNTKDTQILILTASSALENSPFKCKCLYRGRTIYSFPL